MRIDDVGAVLVFATRFFFSLSCSVSELEAEDEVEEADACKCYLFPKANPESTSIIPGLTLQKHSR